MGHQKAAIYARVSTADQNCAHQIRDLTQFAERMGCHVAIGDRFSWCDRNSPEVK